MQLDTPDDEYIAKFVLLRDPNAAKLFLYSVPPDSFEADVAPDGDIDEDAGGAGAPTGGRRVAPDGENDGEWIGTKGNGMPPSKTA